MFAQRHDDAPTGLQRYFSFGRSSMTVLDDKRAEELRRHVRAVTMADERPLPVSMDVRSESLRDGPRKLRQRRRASASLAVSQSVREVDSGLSAEAKRKKRNTMDATVTVRPTHPPSFDRISEMQTIHENSADDFDVQRPSMTPTSYPMYPGLQSHSADAGQTGPSIPAVLNRPRKLSGSTTGTMSSMHSSESILSETRNSPWTSRATSFDSMEMNGWRPSWRPTPSTARKGPAQPDEIFAALPGEVLELILAKLKQLHIGRGGDSCTTCWMRDLCNVCLSSRKWLKYARCALYEDVRLVGPDSAVHKKRFKLAQGARMMLLRRTLRANPETAELVRSIKVPRPEMPASGPAPKGMMSMEQYEDLTATLVMACPNLERLAGPIPSYDHSFKRIIHALTTRTELKDMHWLIEQSQSQTPRRKGSVPLLKGELITPEELQPYQEAAFLENHRNWTSLSTLSVHCLPGGTLTPNTLLSKTLDSLPSLQHLHLCNIPPNAFNDRNLLSLPSLQTLTLSHITGITSNGLSSFATRSSSSALQKLHLRHTPLTSLPALARIFSNLTNLASFSLVQAFPPLMPEADSFTLWMMPYLASASVAKLHWDITSHSSVVNAADDILARSIAAGGFPQLGQLRTPNDPEGVFQDLCRVVERVELPGDKFSDRGLVASIPTQPPKSPISPGKFLQRTSSMPSPPPSPPAARPPRCTDLCTARLAAQARLESARKTPKFSINVTDEDGSVAETHDVAGFMGTIGSVIEYHLLADAGSSDDRGGLVDVRDLGADSGESLAGGREGCSGAWNRREGVVADKKEKERWWHTERGRWMNVEL